MAHALRTSWLSLVVALVAAVPASAQSGTLSGKVTSADGGRPLPGAIVSVVQSNGVLAVQGTSRSDGSYRIGAIVPGTYLVRMSLFGYGPKEFPATAIAAGTVTVDAVLALRPMHLEEVSVTSVSKTPEKQTDAPAAVFAVSRQEVQERPALTVADHLKTIPGVDISQGGLVQSNVVARGFNNIFSGALLTLIDNRYAAVPSLRVNVQTFFPTTMEDIEKVEFVLGPGAALYGPNTASGVLNILTRSPFTSTGATLSLEGGARAAPGRRPPRRGVPRTWSSAARDSINTMAAAGSGERPAVTPCGSAPRWRSSCPETSSRAPSGGSAIRRSRRIWPLSSPPSAFPPIGAMP